MKLIGFDARHPGGGALESWGQSRRAHFLRRTDVRGVMSVDVAVWESLFVHNSGCDTSPATGADREPTELPLPKWIGPTGQFWENLADLRSYLAGFPNAAPYWLIAASYLPDSASIPPPFAIGLPMSKPTPDRPTDAWRFLGYDVADWSQLSGLSNCGMDEVERAADRLRWGARLNDEHLFVTESSAREFADACNEYDVDRNHAPFYVYGLWHIPGELG